MIISLEKKVLGGAVQKVSRFAQRNSATLPVLSCVLIVAGDDGIKFRATNLEIGMDLKVTGTTKANGVVAVPAHILQQIAGSLSGDGTVTLEQSGDTLVISTGNSRSVIKTVPYEDFPVIPLPAGSKPHTIKGVVLKSAIESVVSCASTSTVRPDLSSVFLTVEGGVLTTVATDSFRLAEKVQSLSNSIPALSLLIPAKNSQDILQTIPNEDISLVFDEHQLALTWEGNTLSTRLTSGTYPDYRQIIPKEVFAEATILRKDLETALRRTTIFSDTFQKIRLAFDQKKQALTISAHNADLGESEESLQTTMTGDAIELSFNHRYLQTPLSLIPTESITLTASGVGRPLLIRGTGDSSFLYLVMPMNQ